MKTDERAASFITGSGRVAPFDRAIATVSLRPVQNRPTESYEFALTATFGSQIVKLRAGSTEFRVVFEIHEAEVLMHAVNTKLDFGSDYHRSNELSAEPITVDKEIKTTTTSEFSFGRNSSQYRRGTAVEDQKSSSALEVPRAYQHAQIGQLKIGQRRSESPLEGMIVQDYKGWRAFPSDLQELSGIKAELNVREDWVKFRSVRTESQTILGRVFNTVSSSRYREHPKKGEMFADLLKTLALRNLRSSAGQDVATLDIDAIICRPDASDLERLDERHQAALVLPIDEEIALTFLQIVDGSEANFLKSVQEGSSNGLPEKPFVPHCSVTSAYACWNDLLENAEIGRHFDEASALDLYGRNEVTDLKAAGLIGAREGKLVPKNPFPEMTSEASFKAFIARKSSMRFVYGILVDDAEIEPIKLGERVGAHFGKDWKPSSCRSNGHRLRSWAGFAFEQMLAVDNRSSVARYLRADKASSKRPGRSSIWDGENLQEVKKLEKAGATITEAASAMGVTRQVFYNKRRKDPDFWEEHFSSDGNFAKKRK